MKLAITAEGTRLVKEGTRHPMCKPVGILEAGDCQLGCSINILKFTRCVHLGATLMPSTLDLCPELRTENIC